MTPVHIHLDFDVNTIKIYKRLDYYVIVSIDEKDSEIAKSKKINEIVKHVLILTKRF